MTEELPSVTQQICVHNLHGSCGCISDIQCIKLLHFVLFLNDILSGSYFVSYIKFHKCPQIPPPPRGKLDPLNSVPASVLNCQVLIYTLVVTCVMFYTSYSQALPIIALATMISVLCMLIIAFGGH